MILSRKKFDVLLFALLPIISFPNVMAGIYYKRLHSFYLLAIFFGILSYLFVPYVTNDKVTYFDLYDKFLTVSSADFQVYLSENPDAVFYAIIYFCARNSLSLDWLFFFCTSFTTYTFFRLFLDIVYKKSISKKKFFLMFLCVIFSLSLANLFSGVRFYLATAFITWGYNFIFIRKKILYGIIAVFFGIETHFSCMLYAPIFILLYINTKKDIYFFFKILFFISFVFMFLPSSLFVGNLDGLNLSESFAHKGNAYISEENNIFKILQKGNINNTILYIISNMWIYFAYLYCIFSIRRKNFIRPLVILLITFCNVFFAFPVVFNRYLLLVAVVFVIMVCYEYANKQVPLKWMKTFFIVFGLSFVGNFIVLLPQLFLSVAKPDALTTISLILKNPLSREEFIWTQE